MSIGQQVPGGGRCGRDFGSFSCYRAFTAAERRRWRLLAYRWELRGKCKCIYQEERKAKSWQNKFNSAFKTPNSPARSSLEAFALGVLVPGSIFCDNLNKNNILIFLAGNCFCDWIRNYEVKPLHPSDLANSYCFFFPTEYSLSFDSYL